MNPIITSSRAFPQTHSKTTSISNSSIFPRIPNSTQSTKTPSTTPRSKSSQFQGWCRRVQADQSQNISGQRPLQINWYGQQNRRQQFRPEQRSIQLHHLREPRRPKRENSRQHQAHQIVQFLWVRPIKISHFFIETVTWSYMQSVIFLLVAKDPSRGARVSSLFRLQETRISPHLVAARSRSRRSQASKFRGCWSRSARAASRGVRTLNFVS